MTFVPSHALEWLDRATGERKQYLHAACLEIHSGSSLERTSRWACLSHHFSQSMVPRFSNSPWSSCRPAAMLSFTPLVLQAGGDSDKILELEAAYDVVLMQSMKRRITGQTNVRWLGFSLDCGWGEGRYRAAGGPPPCRRGGTGVLSLAQGSLPSPQPWRALRGCSPRAAQEGATGSGARVVAVPVRQYMCPM